MAGAYASRFVEKIPQVADIVSFRFTRPEAYRFQPGQWFVIALPGSQPDEPWEHHFSHSDSPTEPWLEFTTRMRGSDFKNALDALPTGAQVQVEGPYGAFTMSPDVERAAFLAGGIGITCARSILRWVRDTCAPEVAQMPGATRSMRTDLALREIALFFANHSDDAIPFAGELEEFAQEIPGFRTVHVISQPGEGWLGYRGHLDLGILERELSEPGSWHFFVSGPPSFDQAMQETLIDWGIDEARIKMEQFRGY